MFKNFSIIQIRAEFNARTLFCFLITDINGGIMKNIIAKGLEGVTVDETRISNVEGSLGRLTYRGFPIEELVQESFEKVAWLVLFGEFPSAEEETMLSQYLVNHSVLSRREINLLRNIPLETHPMLMLQAMVPVLDLMPKDPIAFSGQPELTQGLVIVSKLPSLIAAFHRLKNHLPLIAPDSTKSFHDNFLSMFNGTSPTVEQVNILNITQILQMEHGFNASTFAGRVTASTLAPVASVISSAIGTLFGKLHGGADQAALEMAMEIDSPDQVKAFIAEALATNRKIMGMGHREYKVVDPRATILKPLAEHLCAGTEYEALFQTLKRVEMEFREAMKHKNKDLWANVEFYKGAVFYALGISPIFFTSLFAMSRSLGYLAHFLESRENNRLIRPQAHYIGMALRHLPKSA